MKKLIYKILQALKEMLKDESGKISSKKAAGFLILFLFMALAITDTYTSHHPSDALYWYVLGLIGAFWGLSSYDKKNFMKGNLESGK